jgi:hypothetical protein
MVVYLVPLMVQSVWVGSADDPVCQGLNGYGFWQTIKQSWSPNTDRWGMLLMMIVKQGYCLAAFMMTEVFSVMLLFFTVLAQMTPEIPVSGPLTPKAMVIGAYTAMIGVIVGGVIQVLQLFVNSRSTKLEAQIRERDIREEAEKRIRAEQDAYRDRQMELVKTQAEVLRQQSVWLQGWQTTILNQKPGEAYGHGPTFHPDPTTSTPQAIEQAKTLPLTSMPMVDSPVPAVIPVPPEVMKVSPSGSGLFVPIGTQDAVIRENTEAVRENTATVKEATDKL